MSIGLRRFAPLVMGLLLGIAVLSLAACKDSPEPVEPPVQQETAPTPAVAVVSAELPCNPFDDRCAEGSSCSVQFPFADTWDCRPVGSAGLMEACSESTPCKKGLTCTDDPDFDQSLCHRICDPANTKSCGEGQFCLDEPVTLSDPGAARGAPFTAYGICFDTCSDPVANDCKEGFTCTGMDDAAGSVSLCFAAGERPLGAACNFDQSQCAPGLICLGNCKQACPTDPAAARKFDGCPAGQTCSAHPEAGLGVCEQTCVPGRDECGPESACVPSLGDIEAPTWSCGAPGTGARWSECENQFDCAPGLACLTDPEVTLPEGQETWSFEVPNRLYNKPVLEQTWTCVDTCDPGAGTGCNAGEDCIPIPGKGGVGTPTDLGFCYARCAGPEKQECPKGLVCSRLTLTPVPELVCVSPSEGAAPQRGEAGESEEGRGSEGPESAEAPEGGVQNMAVGSGSLTLGELCGPGVGGCGEGLYCADRCIATCSAGAANTCEGTAACIGGLLDDLKLCLQPCNDLVGNDCGAGFTCASVSNHPNTPQVCLPDGKRPEGGPCGFLPAEACSSGLVCQDTCRKPCKAPGTDAPGSNVCGAGQVCSSINVDEVSFCITPCNPFDDKCGAGKQCNLFSGEFALWSCGSTGAGKAGAKCAASAECAPGLICEAGFARESRQCVPYCDPSASSGCAAEETCVAQPGHEDVAGQAGIFPFGLCQR